MTEAIEVTTQEKTKYITPEEILKLYVPAQKPGERVFQMLEIIDKFLLDKIKSQALAFIENDMLEYFGIAVSSENAKIVRNHFKTAYKERNETKKARKAKRPEGNGTIDVASEFQGLYTIDMNEETGNIKIIAHLDKIAYKVIDTLHVIVYNGNVFSYNDGYYRNSITPVKAEATRILSGILKADNSKGITSNLTDVMTYILNNDPVTEYPFNTANNAFPVKNGIVVIDFETGDITIEDHDPEKWKFNYILPVSFDAEADRTEIITELSKYVEDYRVITQVPAQALLQAMGYGPYKKAYLFKGKKNCGKSTVLLELYDRICGTNVCDIGLNELTPSFRFTKADLEGKLINRHDDMGYFKMSETGVIKRLTGGYNHRIEIKGQMGYNARLTAVHAFSANDVPGFDNKIFNDDAFWERWVYVPFDHWFETDDDFVNRVFTEKNLSGFLNEIIDMMIEIRKNKKLLITQDWKEVRENWSRDGNTLHSYICDNMKRGGETAILKADLLMSVRKWCDNHNIADSAIPKTVNDLGDLVVMCGGEIDKQRTFEFNTQKKNENELDIIEEKKMRCYILPFVWKTVNEYNCNITKVVNDSSYEDYE